MHLRIVVAALVVVVGSVCLWQALSNQVTESSLDPTEGRAPDESARPTDSEVVALVRSPVPDLPVPVSPNSPNPVPDVGEAALPEWAKSLVRECGLTPAAFAAATDNPTRLAEIEAVWTELSRDLGRMGTRKANVLERLSNERQAAKRYEVYHPKKRLPDADARLGEYIDVKYEPNPAGGPDLLRIIRIYPGEDNEFDRAVADENLARTARKELIRQMLR